VRGSVTHEQVYHPGRFVALGVVICIAMFVLVGRLYYLQVVRGREFKVKSDSNFVQLRRVMHDRGTILDRKGRIMVDNRPAHDIYITPAFVPDHARLLRTVARHLGLGDAELEALVARFEQAQQDGAPDPIELEARLAPEQTLALADFVEREHLSGIQVLDVPGREETVRVRLDPPQFPSVHQVFTRLGAALGVPSEELAEVRVEVEQAKGLVRFRPIRVARDVDWEAFVRVDTAASLFELPGVDVQHTQRRRYRYGGSGSHLMGYINEVSRRELARLREDGYRMGDFMGRAGLERSFERELRGIDGVERVVVDVKGRRMPEERAAVLLGEDRDDPPQPGHTLVLSVDAELQQVAEQSFAEMEARAGALVAVEVKTGFVLSMVSIPGYDPNVVSGRISLEQKRALDTDRLQPWFNKAIQQIYPPGSTFKVVTALAGLTSGVINTSRIIGCPGSFRLGSAVWRCWLLSGHGGVELLRALQKSCDVYFYTVGFEAGIDALANAAHVMGFGSLTGIDLHHESSGLIGDRNYYERRRGGYQKGYVVNNSIGQGDISVTPLQLAMSYAAIANGGTLHAPQIVREIRDHAGTVIHHFDPVVRWRIPAPEGGLEAIRLGLEAVCQPGGTANGLRRRPRPEGMAEWVRNSGVRMAGKTGTAQVIKMGKNFKKAHELDYWERDHAWFAAYAPAEDPEIAIAVINEHSGHGGSHAAPVAANVIRAYFERTRPEPLGLNTPAGETQLAVSE